MASKYTKLSVIGTGTFGRAWLARCTSNHRKYVVKEIKTTGLDAREREQALTEATVLARCKHINIVRYREAFVLDDCLNIAMEYADGGDMQQKIQRQNGKYFDELLILDWLVQICFALRYIHGLNVLHRDMKTQNIFVTSQGVIKLGDFGIARILQDKHDYAHTAVGTPYYLSPEICQRQTYNHKSDMWAAGCVLYELTCLRVPFTGSDLSGLVVTILKGKYDPIPSQYGPLLNDIIKVLLRTSPSGRPSAEQILCIPAIQPYVNDYVIRQNTMNRRNVSTSSPGVATEPTVTKDQKLTKNTFSGKAVDGDKTVTTPGSSPADSVRSDQDKEKIEKENIYPKSAPRARILSAEQRARIRKFSMATPLALSSVKSRRIAKSVQLTRLSSKTPTEKVPPPRQSLFKSVLKNQQRKSEADRLPSAPTHAPRNSTKSDRIHQRCPPGVSVQQSIATETKETEERLEPLTKQTKPINSKTYTVSSTHTSRVSSCGTDENANSSRQIIKKNNIQRSIAHVETSLVDSNQSSDDDAVNDSVFSRSSPGDTVIKRKHPMTTENGRDIKQQKRLDSDDNGTGSHLQMRISQFMYDTSMFSSEKTYASTEALRSFLEAELGEARLVRAYKMLREAGRDRLDFAVLCRKLDTEAIPYIPLIVQLLQLEKFLDDRF